MPTPADAPLRKITLNLYEADVATLKSHYGQGWSTIIRDFVSDHASMIKRSCPTQIIKRLEDLDNDSGH